MRPGASGPLLQVSKGRGGLASPRGLFGMLSLRQRRLATLTVVLLATMALLLLRGSPGAGGPGGSSGSGSSMTTGGGGGGSGSGAEPWAVSGLEAKYRAQLAEGSGGVAAAEAGTLAEAQRRARKAAALPAVQWRSHAEGLSLSDSAAAAAAACTGDRCDLVARFVLAAQEVRQLVESGGCAVQHCPDALGIGLRPLPYTPHAFGNRCEPLFNRGALEVVRQLVDGSMRGLEWLTGSSTAWLLARLAHLTSVEAAAGFAAKARSVAEAQFEPEWLAERWDLRLAPPARRVATFADTEDGEVFQEYCGAAFVPEGARFDVIAVQGFARMACLRRAVQLLAPQGGLLVLPQAQRPAYHDAAALVPAHWLRLTDVHSLGQTLVWMSIRSPEEQQQAQRQQQEEQQQQ